MALHYRPSSLKQKHMDGIGRQCCFPIAKRGLRTSSFLFFFLFVFCNGCVGRRTKIERKTPEFVLTTNCWMPVWSVALQSWFLPRWYLSIWRWLIDRGRRLIHGSRQRDFAAMWVFWAIYVVVTSMMRAGCQVGCRWKRCGQLLGGSTSAW